MEVDSGRHPSICFSESRALKYDAPTRRLPWADRLVVRRSLFARVGSSSGDRAHTWKAPRGDRRGGPVRAAAILMAAYPFAVLAHDGLILRKAEKLPPPRQCRQYLEQRPEHKREQPDPPEYGVDVVELLHLDFEARRSPGHGLAASRDAEGHLEQEQKDDTGQVQEQAEDLQTLLVPPSSPSSTAPASNHPAALTAASTVSPSLVRLALRHHAESALNSLASRSSTRDRPRARCPVRHSIRAPG